MHGLGCRDVFLDFDPVAVSKLNEKKIVPPGSPASTLLSELKLRAIIENARQVCKVCTDLDFSVLVRYCFPDYVRLNYLYMLHVD